LKNQEIGMSRPTEPLNAAAAGAITLGDDLTVHRLGYGAMRIVGDGCWGPPKDRKGAISLLRGLPDLGINFIDTADSYGPEVSEQIIAEALWPYPKGMVIATKGGWRRPGPAVWQHDASPMHLREAVHGSLRRLRLDRIDVYQLHIPDPAVSFDVSLETLAELQAEGKIRHIGISNVTREHVERAVKIVPIVSVQDRYSYADREWENVLDHCAANGIAFIPWAPIRGALDAYDILGKIASARGVSRQAIALAWLLRRSPLMLPIPGTASTTHLEENVATASLELSSEEFKQLSQVHIRPACLR
jgi:aryl-alcohol dehydrogenase-like predicted oxidoreductase